MNKAEIAEKIWSQVEGGLFVSRKEFLSSLDDWQITLQEIAGEIAGATLNRGPEFHFVSFGMRKMVPPGLMKACLQPIIDKHGFVLTKTPKEDVRQHRFNLLIGFSVESTDDYFTYFRMERLKLHRRAPCLS